MSNQKTVLKLDGRVVECLPGACFTVELEDNKHQIRCSVSGRMRKSYIKLIRGDGVVIEMTPYDLTKGRIIYRKNKNS
ncbi:MAG: translation initiation factor IF-1 [Candidatus Saccharibacteria bacterium]|nr:translation initiation factor IF-1 [Candidatus Saccharibacteria bacterium]MCY4010969.1 translation initiation factor IF-1 [Candidatus Saccharibacteria bacterium]MCY4089066.1 translation initiation factor IF-1 [Candidatus Saccharibacteria bacterium]